MAPERRVVAETGSTNADMIARAGDGAPEGEWLRADRQTAGRGRQGRLWQSPSGNLHASTLVRVGAGDPPIATLAFVAAVALDEAVSAWIEPARLRIKWPNDLLLATPDGGWAKVAGLLLEGVGATVVAGFGVNLVHAPALPDRPVAALADSGIAPPAPHALLAALADRFADWLARWRREGLDPVRRRWLARAHPVGSRLAVHAPDGGRIEGRFDGLDASGALRLRLADGEVRVMHAGDVFLLGA